MITLSEVIPLTHGHLAEPGPRTPSRRRVHRSYTRRQFLRNASLTLTAAGVAFVGFLPTARRAAAHTPHDNCTSTLQTSWYGSCPTAIAGTCSPACGPSPVRGGACNGIYHKTAHDGVNDWRMRPNECKSGGYDGWYWSTAPSSCGICCGGSPCPVFRCHDGCWKNTSGQWAHSICRTSYCTSGSCPC